MNIQAKIRFRGNDHLNGNNNNWTFHWFTEIFSSLGIFITGVMDCWIALLLDCSTTWILDFLFGVTLDTVYDNLYRIKMIAKANKEYY